MYFWYLLCIALAQATFIKHEPYVWTKTARKHFKSMRVADMWIDLQDPCKLFKSQAPNSIPFEYNEDRCRSDYELKFIKPLRKLCAVKIAPAHKSYIIANRPKRFLIAAVVFVIFTAAIVAGVSSAVTAVVMQNKVANEIATLRKERDQQIKKLEDQITNMEQELLSINNQVQDRIIKLDLKINVKTFFDRAQTIIDYERENWLENRYSTVLLDLFNLTKLLNADEIIKEVLNCNLDQEKGQIYFEMELVTFDKDILFMEIDPFTLYEQVPGKGICEINYVGARFLKFNQSSGNTCFLNTKTTNMCLSHQNFNTFAQNNCEEAKSNTEMIQIKDSSTYFIIYCFMNNITSDSKTEPCPDYPFHWSKEKGFAINDFTYEGRVLQIREKLDYAQGIDHQIQLSLPSYTIRKMPEEIQTIAWQKTEIQAYLLISLLISIIIIALMIYLRNLPKNPNPPSNQEHPPNPAPHSQEYIRLNLRD